MGLTLRKTSLRVLNKVEVAEVAGAYVRDTLQPSPTIVPFPGGGTSASCTFCVQTLGGCDIGGMQDWN